MVSFVYKGLSDKGDVQGLDFQEGDESATRVLVVRDAKGKCINGHVVLQKGLDPKSFSVAF